MINAGRLKDRMAEKDISQSELARRVGVSQATIYKLVQGQLYGSKHLHRIARELGTTPAYLECETDDPTETAPTAPGLGSDARELLERFEQLSAADRKALLQITRSMGGQTAHPTVQPPGLGHGAAPGQETAPTPRKGAVTHRTQKSAENYAREERSPFVLDAPGQGEVPAKGKKR